MKDERNYKNKLKTYFILGAATILLITIAGIVLLEYFIIQLGVMSREELASQGLLWIILFGVWSIVLGLILSAVFGKFMFAPINKVIDGMESLAKGDFSTRVKMGNSMSEKNLENSFNSLAEELQNTELLRSDFINNFSHELKTPVVSVSGLITLLKDDNLPPEKRKRYLEVIEEEINRLTGMTTNILNLSKMEKQVILTDVKEFNLSEQIRSTILLFEKEWTKKNLELSLDFDEYQIKANEDILRQVWINLIDNAIKFSPNDGTLSVKITKANKQICVSIGNEGEIEEKEKNLIFNKFYRGENSTKKEGNGIGLSIVSHAVKLHKGSVSLDSGGGITEFTVILPN